MAAELRARGVRSGTAEPGDPSEDSPPPCCREAGWQPRTAAGRSRQRRGRDRWARRSPIRHAAGDRGAAGGPAARVRGMLTVQEAADRVRLTQWAIYRAIRRGDL